MISAKEFYDASLQTQRKIINERLEQGKSTGDPVIELPFDTYPAVDDEMEKLGFNYDYYHDESGKRCASFTPSLDNGE